MEKTESVNPGMKIPDTPIEASAISARGLSKVYATSSGEKIAAVHDINLDIATNSFVCLVGPSGCGKSTLLRIIAGLEQATNGEIVVHGRSQTKPNPKIGMIFQEYSLFPWRTILQNITTGPEFRRVNKTERHEIGMAYLDIIGMQGYENNYPHELSGGMRQRVAIARALANSPEILLMDEPFGALDAYTRILLQKRLLDIWERNRKTVIFVTHSVDEAVFLADEIVVMGTQPGRIIERLPVSMPRPRSREHSAYGKLVSYILSLLEKEAGDS